MSLIEDPTVGMSFQSYDEVVQYMEKWTASTCVVFNQGRTEKFKGHEKNFDLVKYRTVEYTCKHGGTPYRPQTTGRRKTR